MKIRNKFSKLRLISLICVVLIIVGFFGGIYGGNNTLVLIGLGALIVGLIVRVIRFLYRD